VPRMRAAFSDALVRLAQADKNVLLLTGDHGYALFDAFRKHCPDQYINAGIAEQNMVGMAAGLARAGFRPIVYGLSAFVPVRVLEQIKLDVAHDNLPVIFTGDGAGFVYSHLGTSHQSTEDIACARVIPQLAVYSPADRFEITLCMDLAYQSAAPAYLRMGKSDRGDVHTGPVQAHPGELLKAHAGRGDRVAFIATGSMVCTALDVVKAHHPEAEVWSVPTIKPIDATRVADICARHRGVVVLEEHSTMGGLGALVAEISTERAPTRVLRVGVPDRFSEHCGTYDYLLKEHGLDTLSVTDKVAAFVRNLR
jgi:transketolase